MKHIFFIHSSITYYVSVSVVKYCNLSIEDVIFLLDKNYKNIYSNLGVTTVDITNWERFPYPVSLSSILLADKYIRKIDCNINKVCLNENYILYIHTTSTLFNQALITNPLCIGYHFIEEGIANYRENLYYEPAVLRGKVTSLLCRLYNKIHPRLSLNYPFLRSYEKKKFNPQYYYLENRYHVQEARSNVILLPFYKESDSEQFNYSDSQVFIMSPLIEFGLCSIESLEQVLVDYFSQCKELGKIYVKYHPIQNDKVKKMFELICYRYKLHLVEIDKNLPMEQVLMCSHDSNWVGFESSLLFYASIMNSTIHVYSLSNKLAKLDSKFSKWLNTLPDLILKASKKI